MNGIPLSGIHADPAGEPARMNPDRDRAARGRPRALDAAIAEPLRAMHKGPQF
jgi:hypothetical protein